MYALHARYVKLTEWYSINGLKGGKGFYYVEICRKAYKDFSN